ncbi:restriction endonuclease subunit S [Methanobacterium congolense]|uniref:restriction endonuclease subunit S n=1 Tax=Methanobacterium congolense TaxID=118062 RepID=UPI0014957F61|nr:restriction endonuclease subunit S [Methanobacterium congolense]
MEINPSNDRNNNNTLNSLPKNWDIVELGEVIKPDRIRIKKEAYKGDIPLVKKIPFDMGKVILREKNQTGTDLYAANENHLITSKINLHQGAIAITKEFIAATTHYEFYEVMKKANIHFLWYYLRSPAFKKIFNQEIKYRGFKKEANFKFIKNFLIPLPNKSEQEKIVFILSMVQNNIETTELIIQAVESLKKSLMMHLFTYGPVSLKKIRNIKFKENKIKSINEDWQKYKIKEIAEIGSGNTPSRKKKEFYGGNIPWVKTLDLNENVVLTTQEKITDMGLKSIRGKIWPKNTVMIAMYGGAGTVGKSGILGIPAATNQALCCISPNPDKFDSLYLLYYLIFIRSTWMRHAIGTRKDPNISKGIIEKTEISLPEISKQKETVKILRIIDQKIESEKNKKKALEDLFKSLLKDLMTSKIRTNNLNFDI